jgi:hypothetical protein
MAREYVPGGRAQFAISGSAGMGMAESVGVPFVQEVFATRVAANRLMPGTDVVIELGGEDAKILFLTNGTEVRMNGSCAGGTGAFIDQMATLLKMSADEMDAAAQSAERTYTIASRCGVFAKSDVQPLINQGARVEDIAASIYQAVVNQTIAGLAQGRPIQGKVLYLGGPLTFLPLPAGELQQNAGGPGRVPGEQPALRGHGRRLLLRHGIRPAEGGGPAAGEGRLHAVPQPAASVCQPAGVRGVLRPARPGRGAQSAL